MKIVKVYTQTDNKKIAIAVLNTKKSVYGYTTETPSTAVEQFGKIEGEIVSYWGKLPVVLVPVEQFDAIAKTKGNEVLEYRGPADTTRIRESKPRPDAAALRLYKVFTTDAAVPQVDNEGLPVKITVDGYSFYSGAGESLLKALKREYSFTKSDTAAALAMVIDTPADAEPAEQPAAVADTPAPAVEVAEVAADAPALVQAAKETGHLIICSVPKATPAPAPEVAAPVEDIEAAVEAHFADMVANAPADDMPADAAPLSEKTESNPAPAPVKKAKEYADYYGAIVEVLERGKDSTLIRIKGGAMLRVETFRLNETTAKKTTLPDWLHVDGVFQEGEQRFRITRVGTRNFDAYEVNGNGCYCNAAINSLLHQLSQPDYNGNFIIPLYPNPDIEAADAPAPAPEVAAVTDADIYAAAARIRANYEAMQADIEADKQRAADMFADAITAYCESIEPPAAPRWEPETIIIKPVFRDAEPTSAPIHRRRLSLPRLRPAFRRLLRVAAVVLPLLVFALLTASSQTAAAPADAAAVAEAAPLVADAVADTVVYCAGELPPVEVCAPRTPAGQKCCTPSRSKNAVAVADTPAGQKTASSCTPSNEKTAPDAVADAPQPDSQPHGLTICAGTAWQYTMMNWA